MKYTSRDIMRKYKTADINDNQFWNEVRRIYGHDQMVDMRKINIHKHSEMVFNAYEHCEEHGGYWGEEDEDEMYMAVATTPSPVLFFEPIIDEDTEADRMIEQSIFGMPRMRPQVFLDSDIKYWTTKDGRRIPYDQLEEGYARNIKKMLEREGLKPNRRLLERIAYFDKEDLF